MMVFRSFLIACLLTISTTSILAQPYDPCNIPPGIYCTYTQGGWGQNSCSGNNVACLRNQWFASVYPSGVTIGCPANNTATWTTSAAVASYLPAGGTADVLTQDYTNSNSPSGGSFTAQLLAATLNVGFANAGHLGSPNLDDLVFASGPFQGMNINALLTLANDVIGGCQALPNGITYSDFTAALTDINENFDECENSNGDLVEPGCGQDDCEHQGTRLVQVGEHFCLRFCLDDDRDDHEGEEGDDEDSDTLRIVWCCPFSGPPVFVWTPGCDPDLTDCDDPSCDPLDADLQWTARLDSVGAGCVGAWWSAAFYVNHEERSGGGGDDDHEHAIGCACVFFERQLSVELMGFTALAGNGNVRLDWTTGAERENDHFEIQRSSGYDGWTQIANVDGQGTVMYATHYSFVDHDVNNGVNYRYRLVAVNMSGQSGQVGEEVLATPDVDAGLPVEYALHQSYPNPFNPTTSIRFDIPEASRVLLTVFDVNGRQVATLVNGNLAANSYTVSFDAANLSTGTYFYRLEAGSFTSMRKMLLLK